MNHFLALLVVCLSSLLGQTNAEPSSLVDGLHYDSEVASLQGNAIYLRDLCLSFKGYFAEQMERLDSQEREDVLGIFEALGEAVDQARADTIAHQKGCDRIEQLSEEFRVRFDQTKANLKAIVPEIEDLQVYDANCPTPLRLMSAEGLCGLYLTQ